jgi:hypothetical protein
MIGKKTSLAAVVVVGLGITWVLGKNVRPWLATVKTSLRERLEQTVDKYKYELTKAELAVADARQQVSGVRKAQATAAAGVRRLEQELLRARKEVETCKTQLAALAKRLEAGETVRLVSGRALSAEEVALYVQDHGQRLELARQKIAMLEGVLGRRRERKAQLDELGRRAPLELARLEISVRHLGEKVKLCEEQKARLDEEQESEGDLTRLFEQAQSTLQSAHTALDVRLAEFDSLFRVGVQTPPPVAGEEDAARRALTEIRTLLGKEAPAAE